MYHTLPNIIIGNINHRELPSVWIKKPPRNHAHWKTNKKCQLHREFTSINSNDTNLFFSIKFLYRRAFIIFKCKKIVIYVYDMYIGNHTVAQQRIIPRDWRLWLVQLSEFDFYFYYFIYLIFLVFNLVIDYMLCILYCVCRAKKKKQHHFIPKSQIKLCSRRSDQSLSERCREWN